MLPRKVPFKFRLLLPILWYGLIFYLTELPSASSERTMSAMNVLHEKADQSIPLPDIWLFNIEFWNGVFRIGAHLFMFGILGILLYFLVEPSLKYTKQKFWTCLLLVAVLGALDEVHQAFVPGRFAMPVDVLKDVAGAVIFLSAACYTAKRISNSSQGFTSL